MDRDHTGNRVEFGSGSVATLCRLLLSACLACSPVTLAFGQERLLKSDLAEAKGWKESIAKDSVSRWDFDFGNGKALVRKDGTWRIETVVQHAGLRCGQYRVGVRFGAGRPECLEVVWLNEPVFAPLLRHCNNAGRLHAGDGYDRTLAEDFARISCAERVIRCSGLCAARSVDEPPVEPFRFGN